MGVIVAAITTTVERPRLARLRLAEDEDGGVERGDGRVAVARAEVRHADEAERLPRFGRVDEAASREAEDGLGYADC